MSKNVKMFNFKKKICSYWNLADAKIKFQILNAVNPGIWALALNVLNKTAWNTHFLTETYNFLCWKGAEIVKFFISDFFKWPKS